MDKDVSNTIQLLSEGDRGALMRFMHLISDEENQEDEKPPPERNASDEARKTR